MLNIRSIPQYYFLLLTAVLALVLASAVQVSAAPKEDTPHMNTSYAAKKRLLNISQGKAELVQVKGNVSDILVANPNIVDVIAVQSNSIYVVGLNVGDTNLIALDAEGNIIRRIDVHVSYDLNALQGMINELFPHENARVGSMHDQIFLTGTVSTPENAAKIANLVAHYVSDLQDEDGRIDELLSNLLEVRGEQQVMLQVKIVEASRTILKELGVETALNDPDDLATTTIFGGVPGVSGAGGIADAGIAGANTIGDQLNFMSAAPLTSASQIGNLSGFFNSGLSAIGTVGIFIDALEEEDLVSVLAEPNLTAVSGQQAGFLAGGEFPVPSGLDNVGNPVIAFRQFGVSLNFRPTVLSDKRISLNLNTEVSSISTENPVTISGVVDIPGRDIRRAETTVEIPSGASLMIAGLIQSQTVKGLAGLPGIRNTPVLGDLVSSDSFQREETELVVIVTPYLVEPFAEKDRAERMASNQKNPLAVAFADNIRRVFAINEELDENMFDEHDQRYGYLLR